MTINSTSKAKYRPSLSTEQILHILELAKTASPITKESMSILATLAPFAAKIDNLAIMPAYTIKPKTPSAISLEGLGGAISTEPSDLASLAEPKELVWEACYKKYLTNPASCSALEITNAQEHMYLSGLMTESELEQFEAEQFGLDSSIEEE